MLICAADSNKFGGNIGGNCRLPPEFRGLELTVKYLHKIIICHLNINSIRNKIDVLANFVMGKVDILFISESKIDCSFPTGQFTIPGFSPPYRKDRSDRGGGVLLYLRQDIPSKLLNHTHGPCDEDFETLFIEINLHKKKWLIVGSYNPKKSMILNHTSFMSKNLDYFTSFYDNIILLGDLNCEPSESIISEFCDAYNLKNLIHVPTCYKNPDKPSCIDLFLTNRSKLFIKSAVIETGISDFHKMTVNVLNTSFKKAPPKIILYRDYRYFSRRNFRQNLEYFYTLNDICNLSNDDFAYVLMHILDIHAPIKRKYIRINQGTFITKSIRKEIMLRSRLRNRFLRDKTALRKKLYNKQRNLCTYLIKKAKQDYYSKLRPSCVSNNKRFWKNVKPLFSDKIRTGENVTLVEGNVIVDDSKEIAETFNCFFSNAVNDIRIEENICEKRGVWEIVSDPIMKAIKKYEDHPSIKHIKESSGQKNNFAFSHTNIDEVVKEIESLNVSVACPISSIPPKIIKENLDLFSIKLCRDFNFAVDNATFPNNCKLADITPAHKHGNKMDKGNYRPVSILPAMSKIFERLFYYQINHFIENRLSKYQCGFRKGYSAQHCLILMIEKWKKAMDRRNCAGALMSDLSKAFDCLNFDLMIAKLNAYGFSYKSLMLIRSYLQNRYHRVKVNSNYSSWAEILSGVPQGSIIGPLLFNIYLIDLFYFFEESDIASYADDTTPYTSNKDMESVINKLEADSVILIKWINNNYMKANPNKFHILLSETDTTLSVNVDKYKIFNKGSEKLLGITIDSKLSFDEHVSLLCKKATQKLHALARVARYMKLPQRRMIMKAFVNSQFGYCPLVWMSHSRQLNNRINKIQERALRIVYEDSASTFEDLLNKDGSVTIHDRNIQLLATELFKVINGSSPEIMKEIFPLKKENLYCSKFPFITRNINTVSHGTQSLGYLGPKIWSIIPDSLKNSTSINEFKIKVKGWKPSKCPCRLCKTYVYGVGFIDVE